MKGNHILKVKEKRTNLSIYKHFQRIQSIKDLRNFKKLTDVEGVEQQFLASNVEMIFLFYELSQQRKIIYLSQKPYLNQYSNFVYIYSQKPINSILTQQSNIFLGTKLIKILKNIYKVLYNQQTHPPNQFNQFANYIIDHEKQLQNNQLNYQQLIQTLFKMKFILKHFLKARIYNSILFNKFSFLFNLKFTYKDIVHEDLKIANSHKNLSLQEYHEKIYKNLFLFLKMCTHDQILIYPAKKTLDSRQGKVSNTLDSDQYFLVKVSTLKDHNSLFQTTSQIFRIPRPDIKEQLNRTQIMFSLRKNPQNYYQWIQIKLMTDFYVNGPTFIFFQSLFYKILQKYTELYLVKPFLSSFEENINKIKISFRKKQFQLDFSHKIPFLPGQSFIGIFTKVIDTMIILYLVLQPCLLRLEDEQFLEHLMNPTCSKQLQIFQNQLVDSLYNYIKIYLEQFTYFKRKYLALQAI